MKPLPFQGLGAWTAPLPPGTGMEHWNFVYSHKDFCSQFWELQTAEDHSRGQRGENPLPKTHHQRNGRGKFPVHHKGCSQPIWETDPLRADHRMRPQRLPSGEMETQPGHGPSSHPAAAAGQAGCALFGFPTLEVLCVPRVPVGSAGPLNTLGGVAVAVRVLLVSGRPSPGALLSVGKCQLEFTPIVQRQRRRN